jgi:hypothetical protein
LKEKEQDFKDIEALAQEETEKNEFKKTIVEILELKELKFFLTRTIIFYLD